MLVWCIIVSSPMVNHFTFIQQKESNQSLESSKNRKDRKWNTYKDRSSDSCSILSDRVPVRFILGNILNLKKKNNLVNVKEFCLNIFSIKHQNLHLGHTWTKTPNSLTIFSARILTPPIHWWILPTSHERQQCIFCTEIIIMK